MQPLVSVLCLCYNHERFVIEALASVVGQTYKNIEVIIVDDHSTDSSVALIEKFIQNYPEIQFIKNLTNQGNCTSFNKAFTKSSGEFIIDFATDDVMMADRIELQVKAFLNLPSEYGVLYTNACNIDEMGNSLSHHYNAGTTSPSGMIHTALIERYFISPPTMMIRKEVLECLGGYDESLSYEDFDFWIRSSIKYKYHYLNAVLTKRRISTSSHSSKFYQKRNTVMAASTYRVVLKIVWMISSREENNAVVRRIRYELREAFYMENWEYVRKYFRLLHQLNAVDVISYCFKKLSGLRLPVYAIYKAYRRMN